jgi:hypothetical protein
MTAQITLLYETAQLSGRADFLTALELAAEQQMYGAEYLRAILVQSRPPVPVSAAKPGSRAAIHATALQVERDLAEYEGYVANRASLLPEREAKR